MINIEQASTGFDWLSSRKESEYKYIPNNFNKKEGVAFANTISKINFEAGMTGIYNMGNTCFINTGMN